MVSSTNLHWKSKNESKRSKQDELRSIGGFAYSTIVCGLFLFGAIWLLTRAIVYSDGFWQTLMACLLVIIPTSWASENGVAICSITFNWLWDDMRISRYASIVPAIVFGIWGLTAPFRIPFTFTLGDWIICVCWALPVSAFFYNWVTLPFINWNMGIKVDSCKVSLPHKGHQEHLTEQKQSFTNTMDNNGLCKLKYTEGLIKVRNSDGTELRG